MPVEGCLGAWPDWRIAMTVLLEGRLPGGCSPLPLPVASPCPFGQHELTH